MIQAIIFDFDGLIIDTEVPIFTAWQQTYATYGAEMPFAEWEVNIGISGVFDAVRRLEELTGLTLDRESVLMDTRARSMAMVIEQPLLPGVREVIDGAVSLGLKLGVASSSTEQWVEGHLERLGLRSHFGSVRCRDHVGAKKPDPAVYNAALQQLGVPANQAVALEDSAHGLHAALAAGMQCVAVPSILTQHMDFTGADLVVNSLAEHSLQTLLSMLE
jgi:HAD superfamily hydrolase (TIGR01509 family)